MIKNSIAICFTVLFMAMISAPSILIAIDHSTDISCFYDSSEDEEKGKETNKTIEVLCSKINHVELNVVSIDTKNNSGYYYKKYPKPHLNLISPPPEINIS